MRRPDPLIWVTAAIATIVGGVTWGIWVATQATGALVIALGVQLVAGLATALVTTFPERRSLAAALATVVPVIGPLAGAWAADAQGHGGTELLNAPQLAPRVDGVAIARRLRTSLSSCDALMSRDVEARRATIARLSRRARPDDIAILRWARRHDDPEVAVEVALAFEDVGQRFEERLNTARAAAVADPSFATHATVVRVISEGVVSGVVDAPQIGKLAKEARTHYEAAIALDPASASELVAPRARLELAVRRPAIARDLLAAAVKTRADDEIVALYSEAAYAARRFDLTPELASRRTSHARA